MPKTQHYRFSTNCRLFGANEKVLVLYD